MSALHDAARSSNPDDVAAILAQGLVDIDGRDRLSRTPLIIAAWAGQVDNVKALLLMGASASAAAGDDMTGLHFAAQKGYTEVCRILINHGMKVSGKTRKGMHALHFAVVGGHTDTVELLLKRKASCLTTNKKGETAIDLAKSPSLKLLLTNAAASAFDPATLQSTVSGETHKAEDTIGTSQIGPTGPPPSQLQEPLQHTKLQHEHGSNPEHGHQRSSTTAYPAAHQAPGGSRRNAGRRRRHKQVEDAALNDPFVTDWTAMAQPELTAAAADEAAAEMASTAAVEASTAEDTLHTPWTSAHASDSKAQGISPLLPAQQQQQQQHRPQQQQQQQAVEGPPITQQPTVNEKFSAVSDTQRQDRTIAESHTTDVKVSKDIGTSLDKATIHLAKKQKTTSSSLISLPGDDEQE